MENKISQDVAREQKTMKTIKVPDNKLVRDQITRALVTGRCLRMGAWTLQEEKQPDPVYALRSGDDLVRLFTAVGRAADFVLTDWRGFEVRVL